MLPAAGVITVDYLLPRQHGISFLPRHLRLYIRNMRRWRCRGNIGDILIFFT